MNKKIKEIKRLVFHIVSTRDTIDMKFIYRNLEDTRIFINPTRDKINQELQNNPNADVILIGHGDSKGLYDKDLKNYCIDPDTVQYLKDHFIIGIWCFASEFADLYELHGFFTSNFISNKKEFYNQFQLPGGDIADSYLKQLNIEFSQRLNNLIKQEIDPKTWVKELQKKAIDSDTIVEKYNYEALSFYE